MTRERPDTILQWRKAIASEHGPSSSTRRLVLFVLSIHADLDGSNMYPSTRTLATETGLAERTVCTHLERAEAAGWIRRTTRGTGQGWRRTIYHPVIPSKALNEIQHEGAERDSVPIPERTEPHAERTEPDDGNVLKEVQSTSSVTSPETSTEVPGGTHSPADPYGGKLPAASRLVHDADGQHYVYPPAFQRTWETYPERHGGNPKKAAYKAWRARARNGASTDDLHKATEHYADFARWEGKEGSEFVSHASTFFGPGEPWREYLEPVEPKDGGPDDDSWADEWRDAG